MKLTKFKWFWAWDFDQEEQWLNEMSAKGLQLTGLSLGSYTFEESMPGKYIYRMELLDNLPTDPESVAYIHFLEETGVEHVASLIRWVYFRKKASDGPFTLYSDLESRIKYLKRIRNLIYCVLPLMVWMPIWYLWQYLERPNIGMLMVLCFLLAILLLIIVGLTNLHRKTQKLTKEHLIHE